MRDRLVRTFAMTLLSAGAIATQAAAQTTAQIPIKQLPAAEATSKDTVTFLYGVRELSDGRLLVNESQRRRLVLFDKTLGSSMVVADSTSGSATQYGPRPTGIVAYLGDSTLLVDVPGQSLVVVDPNGKLARVMAAPRPNDLNFMANPAFGVPGFDPKGRLVYRTMVRPTFRPPEPGKLFMPPEQPDSAPIVRTDFDTRAADTLGWIRVPKVKMTMTQMPNGGMMSRSSMNPFSTIDDWALLPDGTLAILRGRDYHIDWVSPDGKATSTAKMPFDWKRLSEEDKVAMIDSARTAMEKRMANMQTTIGGPGIAGGPGGGGGGGTTMTIRMDGGGGRDGGPPPRGGGGGGMGAPMVPQLPEMPTPSEVPDYLPPILPNQGGIKADLDGNLWILPTTSSQAAGGLLYDIVNRKGEIFQRVRLPAGRALAGFGRGGVVYMTAHGPGGTHLERTRLK